MQYKFLGRTGLRVSELALGAANFGTRWGHGAEEPVAAEIYGRYRDAGGNVVDTASNYQAGESEEVVGRLIRSGRSDVVLATKFSLSPQHGLTGGGNSRRAMVQSVEESLRRLATDWIDLLWVHYPDEATPIDELMRGLDDLVRSGKILYVGLSNFPAWRISAAAMLAELRGWSPVAAVQLEYSLVERTPERDLLPMASAFGMGVFGWSPLGGGLLTGKYRLGETGRLQALGVVIHEEDNARKKATMDAVLEVASEAGATPGQVAIAWAQGRGVLPILGPRTPDHIDQALKACDVTLSPEQLDRLGAASAIPLGFPHDMNAGDRTRDMLTGGNGARIDWSTGPVR
jgi:aryl-alcohol dehydrogenase-like predicted oxidoreductase